MNASVVARLVVLIAASAVCLAGRGPGVRDSANRVAQYPPAVEQRMARIEGGIATTPPMPAPTPLVDLMRARHVPGMSIAVVNNGRLEWARGYGVVASGRRVRITPQTRFQAASLSKPVTALAALRLVEQGRLALDEDVNVRLRSWKVPENEFTKQKPVTVRAILSHDAGITVHGFPGYSVDAPVPSLVQVLDGLPPANTGPIRVDKVPGSGFRYSGGGTTVLQQLLMDVTGKPFPELMDELVLKPLAMASSTFRAQSRPLAPTEDIAWAHDRNGEPVGGAFHTYPEMAAAGLWTTPSDLARFVLAIQHARKRGPNAILGPPLVADMLTVRSGAYGLGVELQGAGAAATFEHGGSNMGFQCQFIGSLDGAHGVVVMTNGDRGGRLGVDVIRTIAAEYGWPR